MSFDSLSMPNNLIDIIETERLVQIPPDSIKDIYDALGVLRKVKLSSYTYPTNTSSSTSSSTDNPDGFVRTASSELRYFEIGSNEIMISYFAGTDILKDLSLAKNGTNVPGVTDDMFTVPLLIAKGFSTKDGSLLFELKEKNFNDLYSYLNQKYGFKYISAVHIDRFWENNDPSDVNNLYLVEYIVSCNDRKALIRVFKYSPGADTSNITFLESASNVEFLGEFLADGFVPGYCDASSNIFYPSMLNNGLPYVLLRAPNTADTSILSNLPKDAFVSDIDAFLSKLESNGITQGNILQAGLLYVDLKNVGEGKKFLNLIYSDFAINGKPIPFFSDGKVVTVLLTSDVVPQTYVETPERALTQDAQKVKVVNTEIYIAVPDKDTGVYLLVDTGVTLSGSVDPAADALLIGNLLMAPIYEGADYPRFAIYYPSGVADASFKVAYVVLLYNDCSSDPINCVGEFDATGFPLHPGLSSAALGWEKTTATAGGIGYIIIPVYTPILSGTSTSLTFSAASPLTPTNSPPPVFGGGGLLAVGEVLSDNPKNFLQSVNNSKPMNILTFNYPAFQGTFGALELDDSNNIVVAAYKPSLVFDLPPDPKQSVTVKVVQMQSTSTEEYATKDEVDELKQELSSLEDKVASLQSEVEDLKNKLASDESKIDQIASELSNIKEELEDIKNSLNSNVVPVVQAASSDIDQLKQKVSSLEEEVSQLSDEVDNLKQELGVIEEEEEEEVNVKKSDLPLFVAALVAIAGLGAVFVSKKNNS